MSSRARPGIHLSLRWVVAISLQRASPQNTEKATPTLTKPHWIPDQARDDAEVLVM